jgi:hypothetical protein
MAAASLAQFRRPVLRRLTGYEDANAADRPAWESDGSGCPRHASCANFVGMEAQEADRPGTSGQCLLKESTVRSLEIGHMQPVCRVITALILVLFANSAFAQKQGGTLRVYHRDSPASMSIYEETTVSTAIPMMGVFNNLVDFDPNQAQNRLDNIVPTLRKAGRGT